jgi:hypothetical protein
MAQDVDSEDFVQKLVRRVQDGVGLGDAGVVDPDGGRRFGQEPVDCRLDIVGRRQVDPVVGETGD